MNFVSKLIYQISDSQSDHHVALLSYFLLSIFFFFFEYFQPRPRSTRFPREERETLLAREPVCFGKIQGDSGKFGFGTTMRTEEKEGRKERNGRSNCQGTSRVPNLRFVRAYARGTPQLPKSESAQPLRAPLSPSLNVPRRPESARRIVPATSPFQRSLQTSLLVDSPRSGIYAFQCKRGGEGEDVEEDVRGF